VRPPLGTEPTIRRRTYVIDDEIPCHPVDDIRAQPTDLATAEAPPLREAAEPYEAGDHELWAAGEPSHIMRAQEFMEGRQGLVDPTR
jgi:hypothetical protein